MDTINKFDLYVTTASRGEKITIGRIDEGEGFDAISRVAKEFQNGNYHAGYDYLLGGVTEYVAKIYEIAKARNKIHPALIAHLSVEQGSFMIEIDVVEFRAVATSAYRNDPESWGLFATGYTASGDALLAFRLYEQTIECPNCA